MSRKSSKTLSVILAICMVISLLPAMTVFAAAETYTPSTLVNGSFESKDSSSSAHNNKEANVLGWYTTAKDGLIEITASNGSAGSTIRAQDGTYFAELNCNSIGTLYQDVETNPGEVIKWSLYHRGRFGDDTMNVLIGSAASLSEGDDVVSTLAKQTTVYKGAESTASITNGDITTGYSAWVQYSGYYEVPAGQTKTRFAFASVQAHNYTSGYPLTADCGCGNSLDNITFTTMLAAPIITVSGATATITAFCSENGAKLWGAAVKKGSDEPDADAYKELPTTQVPTSGGYTLKSTMTVTEAGTNTIYVYVGGHPNNVASADAEVKISIGVSLDGLEAYTAEGGNTAFTSVDAAEGDTSLNATFWLKSVGQNKLPESIKIGNTELTGVTEDAADTASYYNKVSGKVFVMGVTNPTTVTATAIKPEGIGSAEELAAVVADRLYYLEKDIEIGDTVVLPGGVEIEGNDHTIKITADNKNALSIAETKTAVLTNMNIVGGKGIANAGTLVLDSVAIVRTKAEGALNNAATGTAYLNNCVIANNVGGGIINAAGGEVYVMNSTITGNTAENDNAGVAGAGTTKLVNSIVTNNIKTGATPAYSNTAVAGNDLINSDTDDTNVTFAGEISVGALKRPVIAQAANGLYFVPVKSSTAKGTATYFDYSDMAAVKMSYKVGNNITALVGDTLTDAALVKTYIEDDSTIATDDRVATVIGASDINSSSKYYNVTASAHTVTPSGGAATECGTVSGIDANNRTFDPTVEGIGFAASEYVTLTATAKPGYFFKGWYDPADVNDDGTVKTTGEASAAVEEKAVSTSASYKFKLRASVNLTAVYITAGANYIILGNAEKSGGSYSFPNLELNFDGAINSISISFTGAVKSGDAITLTTAAGFTASGNSYAKTIAVSGKSADAVLAYLKGNVKFTTASTPQGISITVSSATSDGTTFYNAANGHYYQYISSSKISWLDAFDAAKAKTYMGRTGYLATVTSKEEDEFLRDLSGSVGWLGGTRLLLTSGGKAVAGTKSADFNKTKALQSDPYATGKNVWYWACGPEVGQVFYDVSAVNGSTQSAANTRNATTNGYYFNWNSGEPNYNSNGSNAPSVDIEECLSTLRTGSGSSTGTYGYSWNNISYNRADGNGTYQPNGYFVEYGDKAVGDSTSYDVDKADVKTVSAQTVLTASPLVDQMDVYFDLPVEGEKPQTAIDENSQYTGTISWSPEVDRFGSRTLYTATVTLTAKEGYSFYIDAANKIGENAFTVNDTIASKNAAASSASTMTFTIQSRSDGNDPAKKTVGVTASSFNADVIAENASGLPKTASNAAVDVTGGSYQDFALYSKNYASGHSAKGGLPNDGVITSAAANGYVYQLASYNGNNALRLTGKESGTLTLAEPGSYKTVSVLATSANGASKFTATLNFSDGTTQSATFNVSDWFGGGAAAIQSIGRVKRSNGSAEGTGSGQVKLFDCAIEVEEGNRSKVLNSVTVTKYQSAGLSGSASSIASIFAVSVAKVEGAPNSPFTVQPDPKEDIEIITGDAPDNYKTYTLNAKWEAIKDATGYRFDLSTDPNFSAASMVGEYNNKLLAPIADYTVGEDGVCSYTIAGLTPGTTYYYRVRAVTSGKVGYSSEPVRIVLPDAEPVAPAPEKEETPNANDDSVEDDKIKGLDSNEEYIITIDDDDPNNDVIVVRKTDENGDITPIDDSWYDETIIIKKKGNPPASSDSEPVKIDIPAKPEPSAETAPNATINFVDEKLVLASPDTKAAEYFVTYATGDGAAKALRFELVANGADIALVGTDSDGTAYDLIGKTVYLEKFGTAAKEIEIAPRPEAPAIASNTEGTAITGLSSSKSYEYKGTNWADAGASVTEIAIASTGTYSVREKAIAGTQFKSDAAEILVAKTASGSGGTDEEQKPIGGLPTDAPNTDTTPADGVEDGSDLETELDDIFGDGNWIVKRDITEPPAPVIQIQEDIIIDDPIIVDGKLTIDLKGKTLASKDGEPVFVIDKDGVELTIIDSVGGGKIIGANGANGADGAAAGANGDAGENGASAIDFGNYTGTVKIGAASPSHSVAVRGGNGGNGGNGADGIDEDGKRDGGAGGAGGKGAPAIKGAYVDVYVVNGVVAGGCGGVGGTGGKGYGSGDKNGNGGNGGDGAPGIKTGGDLIITDPDPDPNPNEINGGDGGDGAQPNGNGGDGGNTVEIGGDIKNDDGNIIDDEDIPGGGGDGGDGDGGENGTGGDDNGSPKGGVVVFGDQPTPPVKPDDFPEEYDPDDPDNTDEWNKYYEDLQDYNDDVIEQRNKDENTLDEVFGHGNWEWTNYPSRPIAIRLKDDVYPDEPIELEDDIIIDLDDHDIIGPNEKLNDPDDPEDDEKAQPAIIVSGDRHEIEIVGPGVIKGGDGKPAAPGIEIKGEGNEVIIEGETPNGSLEIIGGDGTPAAPGIDVPGGNNDIIINPGVVIEGGGGQPGAPGIDVPGNGNELDITGPYINIIGGPGIKDETITPVAPAPGGDGINVDGDDTDIIINNPDDGKPDETPVIIKGGDGDNDPDNPGPGGDGIHSEGDKTDIIINVDDSTPKKEFKPVVIEGGDGGGGGKPGAPGGDGVESNGEDNELDLGEDAEIKGGDGGDGDGGGDGGDGGDGVTGLTLDIKITGPKAIIEGGPGGKGDDDNDPGNGGGGGKGIDSKGDIIIKTDTVPKNEIKGGPGGDGGDDSDGEDDGNGGNGGDALEVIPENVKKPDGDPIIDNDDPENPTIDIEGIIVPGDPGTGKPAGDKGEDVKPKPTIGGDLTLPLPSPGPDEPDNDADDDDDATDDLTEELNFVFGLGNWEWKNKPDTPMVIKLLNDLILDDTIVIDNDSDPEADEEITIDLNGHEITGPEGDDPAIRIKGDRIIVNIEGPGVINGGKPGGPGIEINGKGDVINIKGDPDPNKAPNGDTIINGGGGEQPGGDGGDAIHITKEAENIDINITGPNIIIEGGPGGDNNKTPAGPGGDGGDAINADGKNTDIVISGPNTIIEGGPGGDGTPGGDGGDAVDTSDEPSDGNDNDNDITIFEGVIIRGGPGGPGTEPNGDGGDGGDGTNTGDSDLINLGGEIEGGDGGDGGQDGDGGDGGNGSESHNGDIRSYEPGTINGGDGGDGDNGGDGGDGAKTNDGVIENDGEIDGGDGGDGEENGGDGGNGAQSNGGDIINSKPGVIGGGDGGEGDTDDDHKGDGGNGGNGAQTNGGDIENNNDIGGGDGGDGENGGDGGDGSKTGGGDINNTGNTDGGGGGDGDNNGGDGGNGSKTGSGDINNTHPGSSNGGDGGKGDTDGDEKGNGGGGGNGAETSSGDINNGGNLDGGDGGDGNNGGGGGNGAEGTSGGNVNNVKPNGDIDGGKGGAGYPGKGGNGGDGAKTIGGNIKDENEPTVIKGGPAGYGQPNGSEGKEQNAIALSNKTETGTVDEKPSEAFTETKENDENGNIVSKITANTEVLNEELDKAKTDSSVNVNAGDADAVNLELTVNTIERMAGKNMKLNVNVNGISYEIRAKITNTEEIMKGVGATDSTQVPLNIIITPSTATVSAKVDKAVKDSGAEIVIAPVEFEIIATFGSKSFYVTAFDGYVSRIIEITGAQANRITTAIRYMEDGTILHIPTEVFAKGAKHYAKVNSLTNSTYAIIFNEASFKDTAGKWFEDVVTEMASRKIVNGRSSAKFEGDESITRAEFAAIAVRALGLPADGTCTFTDVSKSAWYYGAVGTAYEYGLITGRSDTSFDPTANITRQEAMALIQRAAKTAEYTGKTGELTAFSDAASVANWAQAAAKFNVGSGLIVGADGKLNPTANITRAETATVVLRLLQNAGLIDIRTKA